MRFHNATNIRIQWRLDMEYKVKLTYNSWAGYGEITILDVGDKEKLIAYYEKETLIWAGRDFGRPSSVTAVKRKK